MWKAITTGLFGTGAQLSVIHRSLGLSHAVARSATGAPPATRSFTVRLLSTDGVGNVPGAASGVPRKVDETGTPRARTFRLRTLRRELLTPDDYISCMATRKQLTIQVPGIDPSAYTLSTPNSSLLSPTPANSKVTLRPGLSLKTFPTGLHGFLYYWSPPPGVPPLAGEIRFRQTPFPHPSSFAQGEDYPLRQGVYWRIPLLNIASREVYQSLRSILLHDRLVDAETMERAVVLGQQYKLTRHTSRVVHSFYQPFIIDLSQDVHTFYFLDHDRLHHWDFWSLCKRGNPRAFHAKQPLRGELLCRFEPSKDPRDARNRTVVIRVLKALTPVEYRPNYRGERGMPLPREGQLLQTFYNAQEDEQRWKTRWDIWRYDVDNYACRAMRVLFEHWDSTRHFE